MWFQRKNYFFLLEEINYFISEQGKKESFLKLLMEIHIRTPEIQENLETFSVLFNCINDVNPCVEEIGEIAKKLKNLKVFRFWFGYLFYFFH